MEIANLILGIIASCAGIVAAVISLITKKEVQKITDSFNNNSQVVGDGSNNNNQSMTSGGD